jgi:hypothetical protein
MCSATSLVRIVDLKTMSTNGRDNEPSYNIYTRFPTHLNPVSVPLGWFEKDAW